MGHVSKGDIVLSQIGRIVKECWEWLPQQYPYVGLDEWVIMPNHLHGIIIINGGKKGGSRTAPTEVKPLGGLIGAFKTVSTKQVRQEYGSYAGALWQRSYYEHVIRNDADLLRIRRYIINNPECWDVDEENPENYG